MFRRKGVLCPPKKDVEQQSDKMARMRNKAAEKISRISPEEARERAAKLKQALENLGPLHIITK